jgi:DNA-binding CsgD family transcriptional regulator
MSEGGEFTNTNNDQNPLTSELVQPLSSTESQVIQETAQGRKISEIAQLLNLDEDGTKAIVERVTHQFGIGSMADRLAEAVQIYNIPIRKLAFESLSPLQRGILQKLSFNPNLSIQEIADSLERSYHGTKVSLNSILSTLDARNMLEAIVAFKVFSKDPNHPRNIIDTSETQTKPFNINHEIDNIPDDLIEKFPDLRTAINTYLKRSGIPLTFVQRLANRKFSYLIGPDRVKPSVETLLYLAAGLDLNPIQTIALINSSGIEGKNVLKYLDEPRIIKVDRNKLSEIRNKIKGPLPNNSDATFSQRLKEYHNRWPVNQKELARRLYLSEAYFSRIFNGLRRPTYQFTEALSEHLKLSDNEKQDLLSRLK